LLDEVGGGLRASTGAAVTIAGILSIIVVIAAAESASSSEGGNGATSVSPPRTRKTVANRRRRGSRDLVSAKVHEPYDPIPTVWPIFQRLSRSIVPVAMCPLLVLCAVLAHVESGAVRAWEASRAGVERGRSIRASSRVQFGQSFSVGGGYGPSCYGYEVYTSATGKILYCSETGGIIVITKDGLEYPLETAIV
jgi:hypothetical protein